MGDDKKLPILVKTLKDWYTTLTCDDDPGDSCDTVSESIGDFLRANGEELEETQVVEDDLPEGEEE